MRRRVTRYLFYCNVLPGFDLLNRRLKKWPMEWPKPLPLDAGGGGACAVAVSSGDEAACLPCVEDSGDVADEGFG